MVSFGIYSIINYQKERYQDNLKYKQFCEKDDLRKSGGKGLSATWRYYEQLMEVDVECHRYMDIVPKSVREDYSEW